MPLHIFRGIVDTAIGQKNVLVSQISTLERRLAEKNLSYQNLRASASLKDGPGVGYFEVRQQHFFESAQLERELEGLKAELQAWTMRQQDSEKQLKEDIRSLFGGLGAA